MNYLRVGAIYHNWSAKVRVKYDANKVTLREVEYLLRQAGTVGIGAWRDSGYGQFIVEGGQA